MTSIKFKEAENGNEGIHDCWKITGNIAEPISQAECNAFINARGVKCYGKDAQGYIVYGK